MEMGKKFVARELLKLNDNNMEIDFIRIYIEINQKQS